jgi:hypothetical protein
MIDKLIQDAQALKDFNAAKIFKKIKDLAEQENISIFDATKFLRRLSSNTYEKNVFNVVLRYYKKPTKKQVSVPATNSINISTLEQAEVNKPTVETGENKLENWIKNKPKIKRRPE